MLNSGILHHVGTCRLHVRLARRLAAQGLTTLRFDLSGVGDSEPRRDALSFEQSAPLEVREAMDHMAATTGASRFILLGLCSGADVASEVARVDPRVAGLVLIDAWSYRTWKFWVRHYGLRLHRLPVWSNFVKTRLRRWFGPPQPSVGRLADVEPSAHIRPRPPKSVAAADLRSLLSRGVRLHYIFTGGQRRYYNYRGQFLDSFREIDFRDLLRVEYVPAADHIITGLAEQQFVMDAVAEWTQRHWSAPAAARMAGPVAPATSAA